MEQHHHDLSSLMASPESIPEGLDFLSQSPSLESIKTVVKSNVLKFELQKKLLSIILDEASTDTTEKGWRQFLPNTRFFLEACFGTLEDTQRFLGSGCQIQDSSSQQRTLNVEQQAYAVAQQGKVLFRLAKFSDKILRKIE